MSTYKAVVVANLGSDDVGVRELTMLRPSEGQLLVEVHAAGLSFPDLLIMQGKHMIRMKPPYVPGSEVCGRVVAAGSSTGYLKGDWVFGSTKTGGLAEFCLMEVEDTYLLPRGVAPVAAAGFELNYGTAFHGLSDLADLQADDILLVLGASGGVGLAAVGIGKMRGARVVACASSGAKRRACQAAGADMVLDYGRDGVGFRETLSEAGIYGAVDVVFDPVGGQWSETSLRALGWGGRFVTVGFAAGGVNPKAAIPAVPLNLALLNERKILGCFWGAWKTRDHNHKNRQNIEGMMKQVRQGNLKSITSLAGEFRLGDFSRAFERMSSRTAIGKVCVTVKLGGDTGRAKL